MSAEDSTTKPTTGAAWLPRYHDDEVDAEARERRRVEQLIEARKRGYPPRLRAALGGGAATAAAAIVVWVVLLTSAGRPRPGHIALSVLLGVAVALTTIGWLIIDVAINLHRDQDAIRAQQQRDTILACGQLCDSATKLAEERHAETLRQLQLLRELLEEDRAARTVIIDAAKAMDRANGRTNLSAVPNSQG